MVFLDGKISTENKKNENLKKAKLERNENEIRDQWGSRWEFLLSCIGLSVGIGNVWRFPYLAYQNGGGAFLVAYVVLLFLVGKPLYFMELAIGQFSGLNPMMVWKCFPLAKGVGVAMVIMSVLVAIYYNVIMSYTLYYIGQSLREVLPWASCEEWWGADEKCYVRSVNQTSCQERLRLLGNSTNMSPLTAARLWRDCNNGTQTASEQFWERYVLQLTPSIDELGRIKWDLMLSLLVCWLLVSLGLCKGIKSSGKIVYVTATFPYVILVTLVIYGCTLSGASEGLRYFFVPEWEKLLQIEVWRAAAEQLLFSLSIGWGCLIMYASYNPFNNKLYKDAMLVSILDFLTSLMSGVVIFAVLGHMSTEMNISIEKVAKGGQGLAFVTYPEALARLPVPQLWSVLFFFMLFLLAIDSEFSYLENFFTTLFDAYPHLRPKKAAVTFICCMIFFLLGLPCVTQGGQYVLNLMDRYAGGYAGLFVATGEIIMIMWGYGAERFADDLEFMLGFRPGIYWRVCWKYISPLVLIFVLVYGLCVHTKIQYGGTPYPLWAELLGWFLMLLSVIQIPLWACLQLYKHRKNWRWTLHPHPNWGPSDPELRQIYKTKHLGETAGINSHKFGEINLGMDHVQDYIR